MKQIDGSVMPSDNEIMIEILQTSVFQHLLMPSDDTLYLNDENITTCFITLQVLNSQIISES